VNIFAVSPPTNFLLWSDEKTEHRIHQETMSKEMRFTAYPADVAVGPKTGSRSVQVGWGGLYVRCQRFQGFIQHIQVWSPEFGRSAFTAMDLQH